jgi:hypothetical protein
MEPSQPVTPQLNPTPPVPPTPPPVASSAKKGSVILIVVLIILALVLVAAIYLFFNRKAATAPLTQQQTIPTAAPSYLYDPAKISGLSGTVVSVNSETITLKTNGKNSDYPLDPNLKVYVTASESAKTQQPSTLDDVKSGRTVVLGRDQNSEKIQFILITK